MGRKALDPETRETRMKEAVEAHVRSLGGSALLSDITAYCRVRGWTGMARAVLAWLEKEGRVKVDREGGMVFALRCEVEDGDRIGDDE